MGGSLISGAGGFVGQALARRLRASGGPVATVSLRADEGGRRDGVAPSPVARWRHALDRARPDVVYHLAGAMQGDEPTLRSVNLGLTEALLDALRGTGLHPTLVVAGSAAEYGAAAHDGVPVREDAVCEPYTAYGRSKLAQGRAALAFGDETRSRVVLARIFNPVGAGMPAHLALADFAAQIARMPSAGGRLTTGNLDAQRDFIHVDDVAIALEALAASGDATGPCNVCTGVPTRLGDLLDAMIAASGKAVATCADPARYRPHEPRIIVGDTSRLRAWTGRLAQSSVREAAVLVLSTAGGPRPEGREDACAPEGAAVRDRLVADVPPAVEIGRAERPSFKA
ncbi:MULTISPECIES: NAD-dependent epimerase/dehydratase family protein [Methylobacterium]|uniref:NAD-dependent epimerase/dehydratase family protein n=1 Tax=Methylobacterium TaxID=407 RepID=UPI0013ED4CBF|nr:NAD-dependent epimerase/dehydratase family protein [Methylobacterium sp. DB0501]NGM34041.1 NAD-dependent epimerase/dehydratase family protein [Methylobacterium sp. DB0501]